MLAALAGMLLPPAWGAAQSGPLSDASGLEIALQKLNVLGTVLYIGAHPDDENTSVLAYFSKGRKYRTAYLSLTRGEGGQNLIGPEQGAEIGILRTQELLSARRIDGAEQFFTRAVDFGYSKTAEESFAFWGRDEILSDMVRIIRRFRPDVIVTRFTAENSGGHGHHTASAILTREAFEAAGDPGRFPEQLKTLTPWKAKRLLWNSFRSAPNEAGASLRIDTGTYDPLLGQSYAEMAGRSRSQHKSQGFGSAGRRGSQFENFELLAGDPAAGDLFDGIDVSWNRVPGGRPAGHLLDEALASFDPRAPAKSIPGLLAVYKALDALEETHWVPLKKEELRRVLQACAGLWLEATADDFSASPGDAIRVKTTVIDRSGRSVSIRRLGFPQTGSEAVVDRDLKPNEPLALETKIILPRDFPLSQPYWLEEDASPGLLVVRNPEKIGWAENPSALRAVIGLSMDGQILDYTVPVQYRWVDPVAGELERAFEIRPPVAIHIEDKVRIFTGPASATIKVRIKSRGREAAGTLRLIGTGEWRISPSGAPFSLTAASGEAEIAFSVTPPKSPGETILRAEAEIGDGRFDRDLVEISYPHIKRQVYFPPSRVKAVRLDAKISGKKIGYVAGAGDEVAEALRDLGCDVTILSDDMLEQMDLSVFNAVVTGVRAYNTRAALPRAQERLLQFVERGGTLIVQYNVASAQLPGRIGPFPLTVGRDRVCVETAPVLFRIPGHPLLHYPNTITAADFDGWIQER
ncbi:MAG: PIG-L family deacetylase, partial [Candidatus Aminicenantales bacterium]